MNFGGFKNHPPWTRIYVTFVSFTNPIIYQGALIQTLRHQQFQPNQCILNASMVEDGRCTNFVPKLCNTFEFVVLFQNYLYIM
jgi:hypothetical protein